MKTILDHQLVRLLSQGSKSPEILGQVHFEWPSLLEYLGLGSILREFAPFGETAPLFKACIAALYALEEEQIHYFFDRLFTENLNQAQALPQIDPSSLLQKIQEKKGGISQLSLAMAEKEEALLNRASLVKHHLILYLAWDRMCVCVAALFNHQSKDGKFLRNIDLLRKYLIESYLHIAEEGKTSPSIYRLIEALFFYQMREENLPKHTDAEWALLSQSFPVLKAENELVDFFYIDRPVIEGELYLTLDAPDLVKRRLTLANYIIGELKREFPQLEYNLSPKEIIFC